MGRILLGIAVVIVGFILLGWVIGLLGTLLKWALIIGVIAVVAGVVMRLVRANRGSDA
ncbi:hypothetical protein [Spongiactinospora sp. TRM90649]|uniref:hypothetical protein n=1 Tax=Spongiactinospora sp. TRM90649 TaxID=3031114 RepID=UPI0023F7F946|nr:hypothetical protein [Spongiactinospora sp. TRM90649]MDF5757127.1 hypothetical protein [Spongiactinospora sp. TRM90649]